MQSTLKSHESRLLGKLFDFLNSGDIVLGDRGFCSYANIALLRPKGIDVLLRLHQARKVNYTPGNKLGPYARLVVWQRPQRPQGYSEQKGKHLPETLTLRMVRIFVRPKGFRTREIELISPLTDGQQYPVEDLGALYFKRWSVELFFRDIKITLAWMYCVVKHQQWSAKRLSCMRSLIT